MGEYIRGGGKKGIDICAPQETRRNGFYATPSKNFLIYTFGEREGHYGVGFAINKRFEHLITAVLTRISR